MNKKIYKNIKPGIIHSIYENEEPVPASEDITKYDECNCKISKKGNQFITRVCKCSKCGNIKTNKRMKSALCADCLAKRKSVSTETVDNSLFKGLKKNILYTVYENENPVPPNEDIDKREWINKRSYKVSKKGNLFVTKIAICNCGVKRVSSNLRNPLCFKCRTDNGENGALSTVVSFHAKKEHARKVELEKKSREITDCKKRTTVCLVKYQSKKFIPCYGCNDFEKMDLEDLFEFADGFKEIIGDGIDIS